MIGKKNLNSIDKEMQKNEHLAERFFDDSIVPLHAKGSVRERWFACAPNTELASYWEKPEPGDGFVVEAVELDELEGALRKFWLDEPELQALTAGLVKLAESIKREDATEELSPVIYAMF